MLATPTRTMPETRLIESPLRVLVNFLVDLLCLVPSKNQNSVSLSTAEAEYIAAGSCCAQLLWMTQTLKDYGIYVKHVPLLCDNESAIKIGHNPVQHSRTKHIEVRHHFIRDHVAKGYINLKHVRTERQLANIFTKPLDEKVFYHLRGELNIIDASNLEQKLHLDTCKALAFD